MGHDFIPDTSHLDLKVTSNHPPISPHPDLTVHSKEINENRIPLFPHPQIRESHLTSLPPPITYFVKLQTTARTNFLFLRLPTFTSVVYCSPFPQPGLPGSEDPSPGSPRRALAAGSPRISPTVSGTLLQWNKSSASQSAFPPGDSGPTVYTGRAERSLLPLPNATLPG